MDIKSGGTQPIAGSARAAVALIHVKDEPRYFTEIAT
jgi:hypothetical protein